MNGPVLLIARYRIQSDDFPVLGILLSDLAQRLLKYHNNKVSYNHYAIINSYNAVC